MRVALMLIAGLFTLSYSYAQPVNDNCSGAIELNLSALFPCPFATTSSNFYIYNNTDATPASPYPSFFGCGADPNPVAAEVWFSFVPNGENVRIEIEGLQTPNIVLFQGQNCNSLIPFFCASSEPDSGYLDTTLVLEPLKKYYMVVAGGSPEDQGAFNIIVKNQRDCAACNLEDSFTANPPPVNGTYQAGDTVQFCYTIQHWDISNVIEWPHSLEVQLGEGWDESSFVPTPPPSCDGNGNWNWYNEWESCNTGQVFGPGFAYESSIGMNCGGTPLDDNPGNNWGDGAGPCAGIGSTAPPLEFCWTVVVDECLGLDNQADLNIFLDLHSDGESGSWIQIGCNTLADFNFLASAVCIDTLPSFQEVSQTSCPGNCDGSLRFIGSGNGPWDYTIFNQDSSLFLDTLDIADTLDLEGLCAGTYTIHFLDHNSGNTQSVNLQIEEGEQSAAMADNTGPVCPEETVELLGSTPDTSTNVQYHWTGPNGFESDEQNPSLIPTNGAYVLVATVDGCPSEPDTTVVEISTVPDITLLPGNSVDACEGEVISVTASGGASFIWKNADGDTLGTDAALQYTLNESETITVSGTNDAGCTNETTLNLTVLPGPVLSISSDTIICPGGVATLEVSGAESYLWDTGDTTAIIEVSPAEISLYTVTATDGNGCSSTESVTVVVNNNLSVNAGIDQEQCHGASFVFNAVGTGGFPPYQFSWNDPDQTAGAFLLVTPDTSTTYITTITDALGCIATDTVEAIVQEPAYLLTAQPALICSGQKSTLRVEGGIVVEWSTGALTNSIDVTPTETTTYSVMVISDNCLFTSEITVEVHPVPELPDIQCVADRESITFTWSVTPDSFNILIPTGQEGELLTNGVLVSGLSPQESVTLIMEYIDDTGCIYEIESTCTTPSCPEFNLEISPIEDICLTAGTPSINLTGTIIGGNGEGALVWDGPGVSPGGTFNPFEAGPGIHTIILNYFEANCSISESIEVAVEEQLSPPEVSCSNTDIAVEFSWEDVPGAIGYDVLVITGQEGIRIGNVFTVTDLTPGELVTVEVVALGTGLCGNSSTEASCIALSCMELNLETSDTVSVCHSAEPFLIPVTVLNGLGDGNFQWVGACIADQATGLIDPAACGVGTHDILLSYQEGNCTVTTNITLIISPPGSAQFAATPTICFGQMATAIFTGPFNNNYTYNWDFDGGLANTGVGPGPHVISWDSPGEKTISLSIESNGCTAGPFTQVVVVQEELSPPEVICEPGPGLVTFLNVPDPAIEPVSYSVSINGDFILPPFVVDNQIVIEGLTPGDTVALSLLVFDPGPCDNVEATYSCIVEDCPDITIAVEQVPELCLDESLQPFILESEVVGVNLDGHISWSGTGIIDSNSGLFDPFVAGVGNHQVTLSYVDEPCSYSTSIDISIVPEPEISNINVHCNEEGSHYFLSFDVQQGKNFYTITSDSVPNEMALDTSFTIEESCRPFDFDLTRSCDCNNAAGQMASFVQCGIETVTAQYLGGGTFGFNDLLRFFLHDNSGNVLGKVFAKSNTPIFSFNPSQLEYGRTYYVSAVIGANTGFGQIDLSDPCLAVSPGQPIVFSPSPQLIGPDAQTICTGQSVTFNLDLPAGGTVNWTPATNLSCSDCALTEASPMTTTIYIAEVTDTLGCTSFFEATVYVDEFPDGAIPNTPLTACSGNAFEFCLPEAEAYSWTGPNNFNLNNQCLYFPVYLPGMAGTYTAQITLSDGCQLTESIEIVTDAQLTVNSITPDTSVCRFTFFTLSADVEGAEHYVWFPASNVTCQNCATTQAFINNTTVFTLVALAESGCQLTRQITVSRLENCDGLDRFRNNGHPELNVLPDVVIYPNPVGHELQIATSSTSIEEIQIFTLGGKLIQRIPAQGNQLNVDVSTYPLGSYLVRIQTKYGTETRKFVVVR